ncbi:MAG: pyridoxamine 5'-phosphate oxidase family protein [Candidatus Lokiarchaeota archaeon]|nr:pyridoxamine 5'-phosphate oxidase family protein [Candidatus Lokiarchaeota archaeon]
MDYTQAPHLTDKEMDDFLKEAPTAIICSINEDNTIHGVPVWFKYESGQFIIATPEKSQKARNIAKNINVTLIVYVESPAIKGVIVYGKGEVDLKSWDQEAASMLEKYMSSEEAEKWWQILNEHAKWVKIVVKPERMASFDYAKDAVWDEMTNKMGWE